MPGNRLGDLARGRYSPRRRRTARRAPEARGEVERRGAAEHHVDNRRVECSAASDPVLGLVEAAQMMTSRAPWSRQNCSTSMAIRNSSSRTRMRRPSSRLDKRGHSRKRQRIMARNCWRCHLKKTLPSSRAARRQAVIGGRCAARRGSVAGTAGRNFPRADILAKSARCRPLRGVPRVRTAGTGLRQQVQDEANLRSTRARPSWSKAATARISTRCSRAGVSATSCCRTGAGKS